MAAVAAGNPLPPFDNWAVRERNFGDCPVNAPLRPDADAAPGRFSLPAVGQCALCRSRPQPARQQRGVCHLFRNRPRHADEGPQLRADAGGRSPGSWCGSTCISAPNCAGPARSRWGSASSKFGRTSVTFDQVVFSEGKCVASAQSVSVLIDEATRKPTPLTAGDHRRISSAGFAAASKIAQR